jgi:8-amino-7-oxononanoate synthase
VKHRALRHLAEELSALEQRHRLRVRPPSWEESRREGRVHLCSNDYLGYLANGRLEQAAVAAARVHPAGAGASRLVSGEHEAHRELERRVAGWVRTEESIVFTSGYAANVGVLPALAAEGDLMVSDMLNHASIIDGCRLSRAEVVVVPHLDLERLGRVLRQSSARRRWVVTESYFSMDGDGPDLAALRRVCDAEDAGLIVDEAHAMGVFGPSGRGRAAEAGVEPDVLIGTFGKALGAQGAFVAGTRDLCRWLWNRARSFVFSTGLSPLAAAVAGRAVDLVQQDEDARARLKDVGVRLRRGLADLGLAIGGGFGPIIPVLLGSDENALTWSQGLAELGVIAQAIRPPTVPEGTARLRLTASAGLSNEDVARALDLFGEMVQRLGVPAA